MAEKADPKEIFSLLELTVSHMWSIAGLVEVLERKGVLTKQEVREAIIELRRQAPIKPTRPSKPSRNPTS